MNDIEIKSVVEYMQNVWPRWEPTDAELDIWKYALRYHDEQVAVRAIRDASMQSNFNSPPRSTINKLLHQYRPTVTKLNTEQLEPTVFLFYEGGGRGTLMAGHFIPITPGIYAGKTDLERADMWQVAYSEAHGGLWKVYRDTTHSAMIKMRNEIRAESVDELLEAAK